MGCSPLQHYFEVNNLHGNDACRGSVQKANGRHSDCCVELGYGVKRPEFLPVCSKSKLVERAFAAFIGEIICV